MRLVETKDKKKVAEADGQHGINDCWAFVTNLYDYNNGKLNGKWIQFPMNEDEFNDALKSIGIDGTPDHEEYFFSDYDGAFSLVRHSEYATYEELNALAEAIEDCDDDEERTLFLYTFGDYYNSDLNAIDDAVETAKNASVIYADNSVEGLAEAYVEDTFGGVEQMDRETLETHFDYAGYGRDLAIDYTYVNGIGWVNLN